MTPIEQSEGHRGADIAPRRSGKRTLLDKERHSVGNAVAAALSAMRRASSDRSAFVADIFAPAGGPIECDPSADRSTVLASLPDAASFVARCNRA
jgi:hypothetical protein